MKFVEIQTRTGRIEIVNPRYITKIYAIEYDGETLTRVCFAMGIDFIDTPLTPSQLLHRINN